jgi:hypothetical protein
METLRERQSMAESDEESMELLNAVDTLQAEINEA